MTAMTLMPAMTLIQRQPAENTLAKKYFYAQLKPLKKNSHVQFGVHMNSSRAKATVRFQPSYKHVDTKDFIIGLVKFGPYYECYMIPSKWVQRYASVNNETTVSLYFSNRNDYNLKEFFVGIVHTNTQENIALNRGINRRLRAM
jgi:hypothetical protein